ncbi:conjugal transfer protein TraB [Burkholderia cenocepacia]|uniref:conjugal transfer protein TraB n=1 Tax=Burkholderia cenocepacia TaxID=95486 RepID=UPI0020117DFB|nr:conjugal transfer protein TraB [Burkholderia cenocepacia]
MTRYTRFTLAIRALPVRYARTSSQPHLLLATAIGIAVSTMAWYPGNNPIALLALPAAWSRLRGRTAAFMLWATYYLSGARDIPIVCDRFFAGYHELDPPAAAALGMTVWLLQAVVLALPWTLLKPGPTASAGALAWRAMLAALVVTVPPLGIIGWLSPLHVASTLYPGWRLAGMGLGMAALGTATMRRCTSKGWFVCAAFAGLSACAHWREAPRPPPAGWLAVDTALGRFDQSSYPSLYRRITQIQSIARQAFASGATVVILPEEIAGLWRPAAALWWHSDVERMRNAGQTLVIGMDLPVKIAPFRYTDSMVTLGAGSRRLDSRQPVPIALWRPGTPVSAVRGNLAQLYTVIAGRHAAISLCYEDLLWWPHWRTMLEQPDVVVSQSNGWFDADLALSQIQRQGIASVARLAGVPLLRATNR